MNPNLNLRNKSNENLITDLKEMVSQERHLLTQILRYLKEVEDRKLYLEKGFPYLFNFVTEELGYSEAAAHRRIQAMRLIKEVPQVEEKIKTGKISLSVASQIQSFVRSEDKRRKEKRETPISKTDKLELVQGLEGTSARQCEKKLIQMAPETALPKERTRILTDEKTLIQFVAGKELMGKMEKLKSLLSHQNIEGRYDQLFEKAVDIALEKLDPEKRIERREKRVQSNSSKTKSIAASKAKPIPTSEMKKKGRHIPQAMKDQIWKRDQGKCQYRDRKTDRICGSQHTLEIEHLRPYALGGDHQQDNLQLLCRAHNQHKARKTFGTKSVERQMNL